MVTRLRLACWNILAPEYSEVVPGERDFYATVRPWVPWEVRKERVRDRLRALDADLLLLQEVSAAPWAWLTAELAPTWVGERARKRLPRQEDGVASLHRAGTVEVLDRQPVAYRDGTGYVALVERLRVAGLPELVVANVHLKWSPDGATPTAQLRELLAALDAMPPGPRLIAGDFNLDVVRAPIWAELAQRGFASAIPFPAPTWAADGKAMQADAILASGLEIVGAGPLRALSPQTPLPDADEPSDHLALVAELS